MDLLLTFVVIAEFLFVWYVLYRRFQHRGESRGAAVVYAYVTLLAGVSIFAQLCLWAGLARWSWIGDVAAVGLAWQYLRHTEGSGSPPDFVTFREVPLVPKLAYGAVFIYLALQALLLPLLNHDSHAYNLARVFIYQQQGTLFPENVNYLAQSTFSHAGDVLHFLFARFYSTYATGFFSFCAWLCILVAAFETTWRHFHDRRLAWVITAVTAGFLLPVLQATSSKPDILSAVACATALLAVGRDAGRFRTGMFVLSGVFAVVVKPYAGAVILPLGIFVVLRSIRERSVAGLWPRSVPAKLLYALAVTHALLLGVLMYMNFVRYGSPAGDAAFYGLHLNDDGLTGAAANLARYFLQNVAWPGATILNDWHASWPDGWREAGVRTGAPAELVSPEHLLRPYEDSSWFGFAGALLVPVAIVYALVRGASVLRALSVSLLCFLILLSWNFAWAPWNNRYFTVLFALTPLLIAFTVRPLTQYGAVRTALVVLSFASTLFAAFGNYARPVHLFPALIEYRDVMERFVYSAPVLEEYRRHVPAGSRVLIVAFPDARVYGFLSARSDVRIDLNAPGKIPGAGGQALENIETDGAKRLSEVYDRLVIVGAETPLWLDDAGEVLYELPPNGNPHTPFAIYKLR